MTALAVRLTLAAIAFAVLTFVDQRAVYGRVASGQYRDPVANEPSDVRYALGRLGWLTLAAFFTFGAFQVWDSVDVTSLSDGEAQERVDRAASDGPRCPLPAVPLTASGRAELLRAPAGQLPLP